MKKAQNYIRLILSTLLLIPMHFGFQMWQKPNQPPAYEQLVSLLPHPLDPEKVLAASSHQVYERLANGSWKNLGFTAPGDELHRLVSFKENPKTLFALTASGVKSYDFLSSRWNEVYQGRGLPGRFAQSMAVFPHDPDHWFLGTARGLFESDDRGRTWFPFPGFPSTPVSRLCVLSNRIIAAAGFDLWISEDFLHFKKTFSLPKTSPEIPEAFPDETTEEEMPTAPSGGFYDFAFQREGRAVWFGSPQGVFESRDQGNSWQRLPQSGLRSARVEHLAYHEKSQTLFAGTPDGVYRFDASAGRWQALFQGLEAPQALGLALEADQKLLALTPAGFLEWPLAHPEMPSAVSFARDQTVLFRQLLMLEPSARDIHRAVIRYDNLGNGKIKRWHWASRAAAFVPSFGFDKDFSIGNSIDIDRGSTTEPDEYILGPDDQNKSWGWDVSWDLGDLLFSSNQTSIDSREKLMVELRHDLLSEVTRLYFERRRLQSEIIFQPAASETEWLDKLLRMDELTAHLDAMTGGYVSVRLERIYTDHPEFNELWMFRPDTGQSTEHGVRSTEKTREQNKNV